ncbi:zinc-binding alcohol dehydrogenase family protein [Streptomyces montanisoli]|uniref:Zinc-binding alcohol dehydrogenase family protein n=1 Tax=Streptomyces montanisoli TaxID=2798581 RepID=A0A940M837_9ACTN|nr:zinc-binding alcohol dehydrogenase family protein [Streptomyces montanisoli]MBP0457965.1 zinc-binding alcohol dehydrogenase family protein [Streptomyces montanisoli]
MTEQNVALWLPKRGAHFAVGPAPRTPPAANEIVVRVRAIAVNPVDGLPGFLYRVVLPWLTFPAVVGSDVAGEVVEVGPGVTRLRPGDRVLGHAFGVEKSQNRAAEGAFQHYVVLMQHMVSPIPDSLPFAQAAVVPLTLSTAATGMFQQDHLGLAMPCADPVDPVDRSETVLVWGGSTSVGSNAIQLARNAGYRVVATASPHNFGYVRSLGAAGAVSYRSPTAVDEVVDMIGESPLAGTLAIGSGSLPKAIAIAARTEGSKRVASAQTPLVARVQSWRAPRQGVRVNGIWGGTLKDNEVGPAIYADFLPAALASGAYRAAPDATVVGDGLAHIPEALRRLRDGVSATKLVVTV